MKTFKSLYLNNELIPDDYLIYSALEYVGYEKFVPKHFVADLLVLAKMKLLGINYVTNNQYLLSVKNIVETNTIAAWIKDTTQILLRISEKYDLRVIEKYAISGDDLDFSIIKSSFNYVFDIERVPENVAKLLNITAAQRLEIIKLSDEVIEVLTIANGLGRFLKTSKQIVSAEKSMNSYGDIVKVHKHNFADPLFKYKFSIKEYDLDYDIMRVKHSDKIIIGYFFSTYKRAAITEILLKLLGVIAITNYNKGMKIIIYSFLLDTYSKKELNSVEELISYFSQPKQLKLFHINNTKAIETMIKENPGDDIVYLPNILGDCYLNNNLSGTNRVNIISVKESDYNIHYSNVCKKTGGTLITL
jgi:hypothetical protein